MKKQILLLLVLIFSISFTSCTKKEKKEKEKEKLSTNLDLAKSLDFSYFPAVATVIGVIDTQSIFKVEAFKPMVEQVNKILKEDTGLSIKKIKSISAFLSIKNFKNNPFSNAAIILDGLNLSKVKNFPKTVKQEEFEGLNISIFDDKTGFVFFNKKTIGGTLVSVKNAISLSKGKVKNLASTPRNNDFKELISKLKGSQLSLSFVSNKETGSEIKKLSQTPKFAMFKGFLENLKSFAIGLKIDNKKIDFIIVTKSSRAEVETLATLANLQLQQVNSSVINTQLQMIKPVITDTGVEIAKNIFSTLRVRASGEFMTISFNLTVKDAMKIPEIFLKLGLTPKTFKKSPK